MTKAINKKCDFVAEGISKPGVDALIAPLGLISAYFQNHSKTFAFLQNKNH